MNRRTQPRLRLTLAEQRLLRDIFNIAVENYQYDNEHDNESNATKLFTKIMVRS